MSDAIPVQEIDAIVAWHNIVGGVLPAATQAVQQMVGDHYASRAIDQIPYTTNPNITRYVLTSDPAGLQQQASYRSEITQLDFTPINDARELITRGVKKAVFVPYIRYQDLNLPTEIDWLHYGLPPEMTSALKHKGNFHRWLVGNGFAEHTPNHIVCSADLIPEVGRDMLQKIAAMYHDTDMAGVYPLGLMIRGAQSDGNYGMAFLRQAVRDEMIEARPVCREQIILRRDGKGNTFSIFNHWDEALEAARQHISHNTDMHVENQVVITRLIKLRESPAVSGVITNGVLHPLAFNGQYIEPGQTACIGTSTFSVAVGAESALDMSSSYLDQSQRLFSDILGAYLEPHPDRAHIYAMLNIDLMVPDALEAELWQRVMANPHLHHYQENVGRCNDDYAPRVYDPAKALIAEINPRDTNWTLAMKAVLQTLHLPCTVENLRMIAAGNEIQVVARDQWWLPAEMDYEQARQRLLEFHQQLTKQGDGFILRMPDRPAGVIIYTQSGNLDRLNEISKEAHQALEAVRV